MRLFLSTMVFIAAISSANLLRAQDEPEPPQVPSAKVLTKEQEKRSGESAEPRQAPSTKVLTKERWKQVDESVERGLKWLATQQQPDGSFKTLELGQPGVTSLCLIAFLAQGESPADGKYQQELAQAVDYIIAQQKPNGLIAKTAPSAAPIPRSGKGQAIVYNHAISAVALAEVYGQCNSEQAERIAPVIEKAIKATLEMQQWKGKRASNVGGWRYVGKPFVEDSDILVTGWQLTFLRSAKNAGFDVPKEAIDAALKYVDNCFLKQESRQVHSYRVLAPHGVTRGSAGAGVLAMAHAGKHDSEKALASGKWILEHDFSDYNSDKPAYGTTWPSDRYHYGCMICTQAMYQLGGKYWEQFFPPLVDVLLANQEADGWWPPEKKDQQFGSCYSTSLCILSLGVPNQMLPIFQR